MDSTFAQTFAARWIEAWNSHDVERVLALFEDDFTFSSPLISVIAGEPSGVLSGKQAIRDYWLKGLQRYPDLHFEPYHVLAGVGSVTIVYKSVRGTAAEVFFFGQSGLVKRASAYYSQ